MTDPGAEPLLEFREVMRRLRAECPWKQQQTHRSLVRYLVEELHETVDAIETGTPDDLREELGDLLLQVYFHAAIAEQDGLFDLDDVADGIVAKMRRRNPHVFGDVTLGGGDGGAGVSAASAADVNELWESVKATEKRRDEITDGIAPTLPALLYADKVLDRLARAGRAAPTAGSGGDGSIGERLLALVAEAHDAGVDPEQELRDAVRVLLAQD
ncbi:MazG family protein [Nocardioides plantarum]|uniref:MazG family protein n=1 Tax=Nocardioides plantarum TaxID=29299 RepID=A0ABV5KA08_9ACTN|nr:MazG family protein [Nocardioides plantarum]